MTEVPKIVHHRLRAARQAEEGAHPEADVLAAFAERALSPAEREGVLGHLARCGDCREVMALALPETEAVALPVEQEVKGARTPVSDMAPRNWFGWANLRWAALAAGIAVAVLIVRPGLEHVGKPHPTLSSTANQTATPAVAASPTAQLGPGLGTERNREAGANEAEAKREIASNKPQAPLATAISRKAEPGIMVADNLKKDSGRLDKLGAAPAPAALASPAPKSATETVEVTGAAAGAATGLSVDGSLMAKVEPSPIEKAKPARDEKAVEEKAAAASLQAESRNGMFAARAAPPEARLQKQSTQWMIVDSVLERSLDGGHSWQTAVGADHGLLCYANRGQEVWAGGQAGTLQHSKDGGVTWSAVEPSFRGQTLKSGITHIEMRDPAEVVLTTSDHEVWSSTDGGKTWGKK